MPHSSAVRYTLSAFLMALLLVGVGCAGKKKAASAPPHGPSPTQDAKVSSTSPEPSKPEAKLGFFARLNPFHKTEEPPAAPTSVSTKHEKPEEEETVKRKRGFLGRWFGRSKELPQATSETLQKRRALTAKGEVSPAPFEHDGLKLTLGETSKARIVATFGEPENIFFSKGAEELLIYRRIRKIDSLYIFLDSQGLVKDYIITKKP